MSRMIVPKNKEKELLLHYMWRSNLVKPIEIIVLFVESGIPTWLKIIQITHFWPRMEGITTIVDATITITIHMK